MAQRGKKPHHKEREEHEEKQEITTKFEKPPH
jgi:hypothetical protein